jgi:tetratricopeptide (TPR) repeat protein
MPNASHQKSLNEYQTALQWMHEGKYDKARQVFEKLSQDGPVEILSGHGCTSRLANAVGNKAVFRLTVQRSSTITPFPLLNPGFYEEAHDQFWGILITNPGADSAYYGLAIFESMTGLADSCLKHLAKAIELGPRNRIQARKDSDFKAMADDPRFTALLYPEAP